MSEYFIKPIVKTLMLKGQEGQSIKGIKKTSTNGLKDTYTITLTDGTTSTFAVTNGKEISSIKKTGTIGLVDTYTIKFNDDTTSTFTVTNGESNYKPAVDALEKRIDAMFPIGSVYITTTNTNPSTFLKGTWEQFGQGRTLIGEGTGNDGSTSMSFTANDTGGSYNHNHIYGVKVSTYYSSNVNIRLRKPDGSWQDGTKDVTEYAYFNNSIQTSNKNVNAPSYKNESNTSDSSSIQPYIIVYFWKRTA